ncbi:MAG: hypothetical protein F7C07_01390 [Desulfurococcales archaeon]|nr:hypothetical protein [Desulfurococcales archaeon]
MVLLPLLPAFIAVDVGIEDFESTGSELRGAREDVVASSGEVPGEGVPPGVIAVNEDMTVRGQSAGAPELNVSAYEAGVFSSYYEQLFLIPTHMLFFLSSVITAYMVARPLERGYFIFDLVAKKGRVRALAERFLVSLSVSSLALSMASLPLGTVVYLVGLFESIYRSVLFTLGWVLSLSLIAASLTALASLATKSVSGTLVLVFAVIWASLIKAGDKPLSSPLETYGLFRDFYGNYEPTLYLVIVAASLLLFLVLAKRLEM